MRTLILFLSGLAAGCGDYSQYALGEKIPDAVYADVALLPPTARKVGPGLMAAAQRQADRNATFGNPRGHSDLNELVGAYGVCCENVGTAESWEAMYRTWRDSAAHNANIKANLGFIGYAEATSPETGQKCFVVIYAARDPWYDF